MQSERRNIPGHRLQIAQDLKRGRLPVKLTPHSPGELVVVNVVVSVRGWEANFPA